MSFGTTKPRGFGFPPLLIAVSALLIGCGSKEEHGTITHEDRSITVSTVVVDSAPATSFYDISGTVKPLYDATLSSKMMGRVVSVNVREGDRVKRGQLLLVIDPRESEAAAAIAAANQRATIAGARSAETAVDLEEKGSRARIKQAEAKLIQAQAGVAFAQSKLDLVVAGPRTQEVNQSRIAVEQAASSLKYAKTELDRTRRLVDQGALARRELDLAQNRFDLAQGQYDLAVQSESIAKEGSRQQEIRAAQEGLAQAKATLTEAQSGLEEAKAASLQVVLRRRAVEQAKAQVRQSSAAVQAAQVTVSYSQVTAPFDGIVTRRFVDPGAMASPGLPLIQVQGGGFRLEAPAPEKLLRVLKLGTRAQVELDASPEPLETVVTEITPQGDEVAHTFMVKFAFAGDTQCQAGQYGRARVAVGREKAVQIPRSATWEKEGLHYVYVVNTQGFARLRIVTLGDASDGLVTVLSGLSSGEKLVTDRVTQVHDGDRILEAGK